MVVFGCVCALRTKASRKRRAASELARGVGEVTEHEATVSATARRPGELVDHRLEIRDALAGRDAHEREVRAVERLVACPPPRRPRERRARLGVPVHQEEDAPERPQVERTARRRPSPCGQAKVRDRGVDVAGRERSPRRVLPEDVDEHAELQRLTSDLVRRSKAPQLEVREIELAQQHRLRRLVEGRMGCEPLSCPARTRCRRPGHHRLAKELFRHA